MLRREWAGALSMLTYNSTIHRLVERETLVPWVVSGPRQRDVLATEGVAAWFDELVSQPGAPGRRRNRLSAWVQVDNLLSAYVGGAPLGLLATIGMQPPFKLMRPVRHHVWTFRTTDTRIFGWFVHPRLFIAVNAGLTDLLKQIPGRDPGGYQDRVAGVTRWREEHSCSSPTLLWNGDSHDLLAALR